MTNYRLMGVADSAEADPRMISGEAQAGVVGDEPAPALIAVEKKETLADQVYEQMRRSLLQGAFKSGQSMTLRALAAMLNVSATPVREALGRLVAEGALEFGANRTVRVASLTRDQASEIYEIRMHLEGMLGEAGSRNMTPEIIDELAAIVAAHDAALDVEDYVTSTRMNFDFKFVIYRRANLPVALKIAESLWLRVGPHMHLHYPYSRETRIGVRCHREALAGIRSGDPIAVRLAMQRDLIEHRLNMLQALSRGG